MSNNDNKLISLEHLGIVKQYIDTKCGDLSNDLYTTSHNVDKNTQDIASIRNEIADLNLGGGGAMSSIDWLQFQVKRLEDAGADANSDFNALGIGKRFISLESGIDGLDARISSLENQSSTDAGVTENANINADTLINMINSDNVTNSVLTVNSKFGSGIIKFISDNGTINASKIVGSLPASMLNGTISASMLSGTINEDIIPSIPFSKIQSDTVGIKLTATKAIESINEFPIWKLNGDGSGYITNAFTWDKDGKLTIGNNLISWSQLEDEATISDKIIKKIKAQLGENTGSTGSLDMQDLLNNYFGKSIGYRIDANNSSIINDKDGLVITTVTDLLGDKIGVLEYGTDNKVKTTTDANGNVIPVVTTVSNVIGDVTGAKAKYNEYNKITGVDYDKDISVAAKFKEIEKNWIGESFKPTFEAKTINDVSSVSQTSQSVADVFNEMQTDWIGKGLKPEFNFDANGVKTRKSQNIEDILNELKTKWFGEENVEANGNSIKLGVVRNEDGTIKSETSAAKVFNEIQTDWLGIAFKPVYDNNIRTTQSVYDVISELKQRWLGNLINANTSVSSKITECLDKININASAISTNKNIYDLHKEEYNKFNASTIERFGIYDQQMKNLDDRITSVASLSAGSLTVENVANVVNVAIKENRLDVYTKEEANNTFVTKTDFNAHTSAAETKYETKENVEAKLANYLNKTNYSDLNTMLNNANVINTGWYNDIETAILAITDGKYAKSSTADTLSSYLTKTDASTTYLTKTDASNTYLKTSTANSTYLSKTDASNTYLTKTDASNTYLKTSTANSTYLSKTDANSTYLKTSTANSTYVPLTTYNNLAAKYDQLKDDYDSLLARVVALEAKVQ